MQCLYVIKLVWGNPWEVVINFGKSFLLVLSESIGNLSQKTVGYPSRKGVHHIFFERQKYGLITAYHRRKDVKYLTSQKNIKILKFLMTLNPWITS